MFANLFRLIVLAGVVYLVSRILGQFQAGGKKIRDDIESPPGTLEDDENTSPEQATEMVRCTKCGIYIAAGEKHHCEDEKTAD